MLMLAPNDIDHLICTVSGMPREEIIRQCLSFRGSFPVDFTAEFLNGLDIEELRHIFAALCLQTRRMPAECPQPA